MSTRRRMCLWLALLLVGLAALSYVIVALATTKPQWLAEVDAFHKRHRLPDERIGPEASALQSLIWEDILRRPNWTAEDVDELWAIYDQFVESRQPEDPEEYKRWKSMFIVRSSAISALELRLEQGGSVTREAAERAVAFALDDLHHEWYFRRRNAAVFLIDGGVIEERPVRLAVERLLDDPHEKTRDLVAFMLNRYDDLKSRRLALEERKRALQERKATVKEAP